LTREKPFLKCKNLHVKTEKILLRKILNGNWFHVLIFKISCNQLNGTLITSGANTIQAAYLPKTDVKSLYVAHLLKTHVKCLHVTHLPKTHVESVLVAYLPKSYVKSLYVA